MNKTISFRVNPDTYDKCTMLRRIGIDTSSIFRDVLEAKINNYYAAIEQNINEAIPKVEEIKNRLNKKEN